MKRIIPLCLVFLLLLAILPGVSAAETGSITIRIPSGGTVTLYRVADPHFVPVPEFAGCDIALTPAAAQALADHAGDLPGDTRAPDAAGCVRFQNLAPGLYLLVQHGAEEGYLPFSPFLVSIPTRIGDVVYYDVDASPKISVTPTPPPGLPQTGQLRWPVPLLVAGGLCLILIGASGRRKREA